MGEVGGVPNTKTVTVRNRSLIDVELALASDTKLFSVSPASFRLPAGGSFVVFVESQVTPSAIESQDTSADVVVTAERGVLRHIPIEFSKQPKTRVVSLGNTRVRHGRVLFARGWGQVGLRAVRERTTRPILALRAGDNLQKNRNS